MKENNKERGHRIGPLQKDMLNFLIRHPNEWHSIAKDSITQKVAKSLHKRGLIRMNEHNQIAHIHFTEE